jgi:hypothetical protein
LAKTQDKNGKVDSNHNGGNLPGPLSWSCSGMKMKVSFFRFAVIIPILYFLNTKHLFAYDPFQIQTFRTIARWKAIIERAVTPKANTCDAETLKSVQMPLGIELCVNQDDQSSQLIQWDAEKIAIVRALLEKYARELPGLMNQVTKNGLKKICLSKFPSGSGIIAVAPLVSIGDDTLSINPDLFFQKGFKDPYAGFERAEHSFLHELLHIRVKSAVSNYFPDFLKITGWEIIENNGVLPEYQIVKPPPPEWSTVKKVTIWVKSQGRVWGPRDNGSKSISRSEIDDAETRAEKVLAQTNDWVGARRVARDYARGHGFPTIYSMTDPDESFAEFGAFIYLDPTATQYMTPEVIQFFKKNILR